MLNLPYPVEKILSNLKIDALNEMQLASIEAHKSNDNIMLLSATGSGKTLAYLLPILNFLDKPGETTAMIVVPSRELALQIEQVFKAMQTGHKITCCYGGHLRETEENNLLQPPALLVGTPGRIADHIRRGNIMLDSINIIVLDEFDKSLEAGFTEELSAIIGALKFLQKRILISATESLQVPAFVGLTDPLKLNYLPAGNTVSRLTVKTIQADEKDKTETLFRLLCFIGNRSTVIFCNHREAVERTSNFLTKKGIINEFYHGALEQQERDSALCKFRNGTVHFLVTTDLASRGLDIFNIRYIIHYHLPHTEEAFIHRNGRTARMEASGTAILILSGEEKVPAYVHSGAEMVQLPETTELPEKPKWTTLFIAAGKKDKVNKIDIAGFLLNKGELKKDDIGLIDVKDFFSFVAVRKLKVNNTLQLIKTEKIKNKKVKIEVAR